mmetsp:Transcript_20806/g.39091  ORF Transcript_20806/g.39091 Transcript_20806/m.39091 type:complete len:340 (-) Transcript_20806:65-1084(-)
MGEEDIMHHPFSLGEFGLPNLGGDLSQGIVHGVLRLGVEADGPHEPPPPSPSHLSSDSTGLLSCVDQGVELLTAHRQVLKKLVVLVSKLAHFLPVPGLQRLLGLFVDLLVSGHQLVEPSRVLVLLGPHVPHHLCGAAGNTSRGVHDAAGGGKLFDLKDGVVVRSAKGKNPSIRSGRVVDSRGGAMVPLLAFVTRTVDLFLGQLHAQSFGKGTGEGDGVRGGCPDPRHRAQVPAESNLDSLRLRVDFEVLQHQLRRLKHLISLLTLVARHGRAVVLHDDAGRPRAILRFGAFLAQLHFAASRGLHGCNQGRDLVDDEVFSEENELAVSDVFVLGVHHRLL